jgi:Trk K+ transport system NAD-binding subunit
VPSLPSRRASGAQGFVVCGSSPLAYRLVSELVTRFDAKVTVIMRSRERDRGPQIAALRGVTVIEAAELDDTTLRAAGVAEARALALVEQNDIENIHTSLRAHELNPNLRMVIRMFNMSLGHRVRTLFADCAVLSDSAMAAPSFVAAALGEVAPSHVRLPGRTLYMARRAEVPAKRIVCGLADTSGRVNRLLPADQDSADLVLAIADGPAEQERTVYRRALRSRLRVWSRAMLANQLARIAVGLVVLLALGFVLIATAGRESWRDAMYLTLLDAAGAAQPDLALSTVNRVVQVGITLVGISLIPVVTAAVVDALVTARLADGRAVPESISGHVVVAGLGNLGSRVIRQLHDLGVPVVCVDNDEHARGVSFARDVGLPVVFGDITRERVLRAAAVPSCRALVLLTSDDMVNLEAGLQGRALREDLRVVLRLFDDDLAERVDRNFGFANSRSVSRVCAPPFAAAMVERQVIGTLPIGRNTLMIAEVPVAAGAPLVHQPIGDTHQQGQVRVIGLQRKGASRPDWSPGQTYRLAAGDRLLVLATRAGLGEVLARSISPLAAPGAG